VQVMVTFLKPLSTWSTSSEILSTNIAF